MADSIFSFEQFDFDGIGDKWCISAILEGSGGRKKGNQTQFYGAGDWGESANSDYLCSGFGFGFNHIDDAGFLLSKYQQQEDEQQKQSFLDYEFLDDLHFDVVSQPIQLCQEDYMMNPSRTPTGIPHLVEPKKKGCPFSSTSLELLKNYRSGIRLLNEEKLNEPKHDTASSEAAWRRLSTEEVMRVAGERFMQSFQSSDGISMLSHPFGPSFSGLSEEEIRDVRLAEVLLASVDKVVNQQFEAASRMLNQCDYFSSSTGNPVQRVVYHFSEALREKIDRETGRIRFKPPRSEESFDPEESRMGLISTLLARRQEVPFSQVARFTGIQVILENVAEAKRVHLIDLEIRSGVQWTILMQALAVRYECPLELVKITAVGTTSRQKIEETGRRLVSFAQTMNLPFSFKLVMVSNMLYLKEDLFEIEADEAIAVYAPASLRTMIAQPERLECLMRVIRSIDPCVMVVSEVEANHNSPVFVNRFIEALFYVSAFSDCLEACFNQDCEYRRITEYMYFGHGIRNMLAADGEERKVRSVNIDVWRAFFARFGMVEIQLSKSSLYQASLLAKEFACGSSCTLDMNQKCLLIGWRGTPILSLSAWNFLT
ncbi:hypothetical protein PVL29_005578 [Vitis rotundifolia]|uniref:DELLA protein RGL1 n=1 Tax=Vitis rotundifolia TaxID=103349 RepID=A0AA39DY62_VITRO|nr:hypothetical protein PVL29_005578 [Vitis rotundifolia]